MSNTDKDNPKDKAKQQQEAAANVLRQKLQAIYDSAPDAGEELAGLEEIAKKDRKTKDENENKDKEESKDKKKEPKKETKNDAKQAKPQDKAPAKEPAHKKEPETREERIIKPDSQRPALKLSKHQKYLQGLSQSGRSLAEIQSAWHAYYEKLSDKQKHEVWQEFYDQHAQKRRRQLKEELGQTRKKVNHEHEDREKENQTARPKKSSSKAAEKKQELLDNITARARKSQGKSHKHALLFGLGMGTFFLFIILFSFFNERFITPFIRPNQNVSATSIILDPAQTNVGKESKIIIPKINVEAPVVYDVKSVEEKAVQKGLERGVVHYSITPEPGERGNSVIVGHSSSNILNSGRYKFAFLLLKSLEKDDTFYVQKDGTRYAYKVFKKFVTSPDDTSVLNPTDRKATMTLITCDPPGLSVNRLIIQAEQIYPDPKKNKKSSVDITNQQKPEELGGNSISLWQRIVDWF